jgi:C-terminal processing protease CtpA/Prc
MRRTIPSLLAIAFLLSCPLFAQSQTEPEKNISASRVNGLKMSRVILEQLKNNYYDPKFHGLDLEARFKLADQKIKEALTAGQVFGILAQAVLELNDSHTALIPPLRGEVAVYGWRMKMIGDICYITDVKQESDAEAKGLKAGDQLIAIDGTQPTRENIWRIKYYYYALRPKTRVQLVVQSPEGQRREVEVLTRFEKKKFIVVPGAFFRADNIGPELGAEAKRELAYEEFGPELIICRLPSFDMEEGEIDKMMRRIDGHKTLVLDLRNNPGGLTDTLKRFVGYFFDRDVKIGDFKMRRETKEILVKPRKSNRFAGELFVLINSESKSAAELFARIVQLEKRGTVIGDHSAGMVMQSLRFDFGLTTPGNERIVYGLNITNADIHTSDGKSLEWIGVSPDKIMRPTADDLRGRRDPVLAYAASLAGVQLDSEKAGMLFPAKEPKKN